MENNISDKIDSYLDGKMSAEENSAFEKEISTNKNLRQQVEMQKNLRQGIERLNLKSSITSQFKKMTLKSKIYKWGIATVAIAAIGTATYFGYNQLSGNSSDNYTLPTLNEEGKAEWSDADKNLPTQIFSIDPNKDTVLETDGGIVFAIPAGAFLDAKEPVTLEVREALTPTDIMKGGLSTTSDGKLLETGGMFYLNARNGEQSLKINPAKPVYANVPTNEIKSDMQLFTGERKPDGSINWTNPKPLEKQLIPVDIHSLDFYPKGFRAKVAELGFDANDKRVTDSIYYSYSGRGNYAFGFCGQMQPQGARYIDSLYMAASVVKENAYAQAAKLENSFLNPVQKIANKKLADEARKKADEEYNNVIEAANSHRENVIYEVRTDTMSLGLLEINPARISAIWNDKFQNTIISTKEFEERLQVIFKYGDADILNLYVNNLDKKMFEIDSIIMHCNAGTDAIIYSEFKDFYLRHDGGISITENHMKKLQEYFNKKREAVQMAAEKTFASRKENEQKQDKTYTDAKTQQLNDDEDRKSENFQKEYAINLTEAYRQLGIKRDTSTRTNEKYYGFTVPTTGWCNVDRYVYESTLNRTTLDYTDPNSGKKAVIQYLPLTISINNEKDFEQVQVYLVPDSLNSFMKVNKKGNVFEENLNELFKYSLVVVAQKNKKWYWVNQSNVKSGTTAVQLAEIAESQLRVNLDHSFTKKAGSDFRNELDMMIEQHTYNIQLKQRQKQKEIDNAIMPVIFPFYVPYIAPVPKEPKIRVG